jgi:hypothetical protein
MKKLMATVLVFSLTLVGGCAQRDSKQQIMSSDSSQVALRQIQSRVFDTADRKKTLRTIIATLQDLSFVIDKADEELGSVSGTKLSGYNLRMTVTIRPRGEKQTIVRANAQYNLLAVEDPIPYQQFFAALEKSMFLTAQQVD